MSQPYAHTQLERLWRLVGRLEVILGLRGTSPEEKLGKITDALNELGLSDDGGQAGDPDADGDLGWTVLPDGSVSFHGFAADDQPPAEGGEPA